MIHDIFISYRRDGGEHLAGRVKDALKTRGFSVFMDVEDLKSGRFDEALFEKIEQATDFIVILTPECLARCKNDGDWLRQEIKHAIACSRNIVPIMARGFRMPDPEDLPHDMRDFVKYNGFTTASEMFDASIDKLTYTFLNSKAHTELDEGSVQRVPHLFGDMVGIALHGTSGVGVCPICGDPHSAPAPDRKPTWFECRECGQKPLCQRHRDREVLLCISCARTLRARAAELISGAKSEADPSERIRLLDEAKRTYPGVEVDTELASAHEELMRRSAVSTDRFPMASRGIRGGSCLKIVVPVTLLVGALGIWSLVHRRVNGIVARAPVHAHVSAPTLGTTVTTPAPATNESQVSRSSVHQTRSLSQQSRVTAEHVTVAQPVERTNKIDGAVMVWIDAGPFLSGDEDIEDNGRTTITLPGYWIYKNLVTVGQFKKYVSATQRTGSVAHMPVGPNFDKHWSQDDHPVVNISWEDAEGYCKWAGVAMPTEWQWEKAARGTDGWYYPWGNEFKASKLWCSIGTEHSGTTSVGKYGVSPYGCTDMAGNVWQWCLDEVTYGYKTVWRGGSYRDVDESLFRAAHRFSHDPQFVDNLEEVGFRCVSSDE